MKTDVKVISNDIQDVQGLDLIAETIDHPLAIVFNKSSSPNYVAAVLIAKQAYKYSEILAGKSIMHMCVFSSDRVQLSKAYHLLKYVKGYKSTIVYSRGKVLFSANNVEYILSCYLDSMACDNWKAHCHKIVHISCYLDGILDLSSDRYLIPCRMITGFKPNQVVDEVSVHEAFQAKAVEKGCEWCPNFHPYSFKLIEDDDDEG